MVITRFLMFLPLRPLIPALRGLCQKKRPESDPLQYSSVSSQVKKKNYEPGFQFGPRDYADADFTAP